MLGEHTRAPLCQDRVVLEKTDPDVIEARYMTTRWKSKWPWAFILFPLAVGIFAVLVAFSVIGYSLVIIYGFPGWEFLPALIMPVVLMAAGVILVKATRRIYLESRSYRVATFRITPEEARAAVGSHLEGLMYTERDDEDGHIYEGDRLSVQVVPEDEVTKVYVWTKGYRRIEEDQEFLDGLGEVLAVAEDEQGN